MESYDPAVALEELTEEAVLPSPVRMRDMIIRAHLSPEGALELNRKFQNYLNAFGELQGLARDILKELATPSTR